MAERKKVSSVPKKASEQPVNAPDQQSQASAQKSEALAASSGGNPPAKAPSTSQQASQEQPSSASGENHPAPASSGSKQQVPEEKPVASAVRPESGAFSAVSGKIMPPSAQATEAPGKNHQKSEASAAVKAVKQGSGGIGPTSGGNPARKAPGAGGGTSSLSNAAASARNSAPEAENAPENAGGGGNAATGMVIKFDSKLGYGFIAPSDGSKEIFVHYSEIRTESPFRTLKKGEDVEFVVAPGLPGYGGLRALNVTRIHSQVQGNGGSGSSPAGKAPAAGLAPKAHQIVPPQPPAASSQNSAASQPENPPVNAGNLKTGTVTWFDPLRGFGFITPSDGTGNLFVHKSSILCKGVQTLHKWEPVEFEVRPDRAGNQRAINVRSRAGEAVKTGEVSWFSPDRGFGFITPRDGCKRVFVHVSGIIGTLQLHEPVEYELATGFDSAGRPRAIAINVRSRAGEPAAGKPHIVAPQPPQPDHPPGSNAGSGGSLKTGVLSMLVPAGGYGFITPSDGSGNVFVHTSSIVCEDPRKLREGDAVEFEVRSEWGGRLEAVNVRSRAGGSGESRNGGRCYLCGQEGHIAREGVWMCDRCNSWGPVDRHCYLARNFPNPACY